MTALCVYGYYLLGLTFAKKEDTPIVLFIVTSIIILALYLAALLGLLHPVAVTIKYAGVLALPMALAYYVWKKPKNISSVAVSPVAILFLAWCLLAWWITRGYGLTHWDEFSHWGLYAKQLFFTHELPKGRPNPIIFSEYPPGASLFHYFGVVGGSFDEDSLYHAVHVLALAPIALLLGKLSWKNTASLALVTLVIYSAFISIGQGFKAILADQALSVWFSGAILAYTIYCRKRAIAIALLCLPLSCLVLIKGPGTLFYSIALLFILADLWIRKLKFKQLHGNNSSHILLVMVALLAVPLLISGSWRWQVDKYNLRPSVDTHKVTVKDVINGITQNGSPKENEIARRYYKAIGELRLGGTADKSDSGYPILAWVFIFTLIFAVTWRLAPVGSSERWTIVILHIAMLAGFVSYLLGLLILYQFSFPGESGKMLASVDRYLATYLLGWLIVSIGMFISSCADESRRAIGLAMLAAVIIYSHGAIQPLSKFDQETRLRAAFTAQTAFINSVVPQDKSVFIACNTLCQGAGFFITRYEIAPRFSNWAVWTPAMVGSVELAADAISSYDYVYIVKVMGHTDEKLAALINNPNGPKDPFLFSVSKDGSGGIMLDPVNHIPAQSSVYSLGDKVHSYLAKDDKADAIYHDMPGRFRPISSKDSFPSINISEPLFIDTCLEGSAASRPAYIFSNKRSERAFLQSVESSNVTYETSQIDGLNIYYGFRPQGPKYRLQAISYMNSIVTSTADSASVHTISDGNASTIWYSGEPQNNNEIIYDFMRSRNIGGLDIMSGANLNAPQKLEIHLSDDKTKWRKVASTTREEAITSYRAGRPSVDIYSRLLVYRFVPSMARYMRLKPIGNSVDPLHIVEAWVYESTSSVKRSSDNNMTGVSAQLATQEIERIIAHPFIVSRLSKSTPAPWQLASSSTCGNYQASNLPVARPAMDVSQLDTIITDDLATPAVEAYLSQEGVESANINVAGYTIFKNPVHPLTRRAPSAPDVIASVSASHNGDDVSFAYDGNPETVWRSGEAQQTGMSLVIELRKRRLISGLALDVGPDFLDSPRAALVEISDDGLTWARPDNPRRVHRQFVIEEGYILGSDTALVYSFDAASAKYLRVSLIEDRDTYNWSVRNIVIYQP
ncbi:MAG: discoidin domain-containing protein [Nitrospinota bacterium]|nr:discoidin domain-containing protein [Nitrospinota bacterium]